MEGARATRLQSLSEALSGGFDQFAFRIKAQTRDMDQADTIRVLVAIQYRTRSWQTIDVDLGPANIDRVDLIEPKVRGLVELGIPVTSPVRCWRLAEQVAQELHACTGPAAAGRARDILDILLIDAVGQLVNLITERLLMQPVEYSHNGQLTRFRRRSLCLRNGDQNWKVW